MAELRRGGQGVFAAALSEKRIFIQSVGGTRYVRLTTGRQLLLGTAAILAIGWLSFSTARLAVDAVAASGDRSAVVLMQDEYAARLNALTEERDARAAEALSAQTRFQTAMDQISRQHTDLLGEIKESRELESALELMRKRLGDAIGERDALIAQNDRLSAQIEAMRSTMASGQSHADLTETLEILTATLSETAAARDQAAAERTALAAELAANELELKIATRRHEEMIAEVRDAVVDSAGSLENLLERAELDVDTLLASVQTEYSGQGGPLIPLGMSTRSFDGDAATTRSFDALMVDVDRMNMLRIAIGKVPYAIPVKNAYRFTSGFGMRRDPKGGGRRMHAGVDFAAPKGTPIYATADGVVKSAGRESAYGNTVRITHDFGFETVYAHQTRLLVKAGQRVSRGDHIGDMGATGRVTGVHLHYEVRLNGRPMNPMIYVEAAKDVF